MGRQNWYYGNHPPACTCVACNEGKIDHQSVFAHMIYIVIGILKRFLFLFKPR